MNDEEITPDGQTMREDNNIGIPNTHDNHDDILLPTVVDENNAGPTNADSENTMDDDTPIIDLLERYI